MGVQVKAEEAADVLVRDSRDACVRLLALRRGERWVLNRCWALVGAEPPGWGESMWMYEHYAFVAARTAASDLALMFSVDACPSVVVGPLTFWTPGAHPTAIAERRPGYSRLDRLQLPFPVAEYTVSAADPENRQLPPAHLPSGMLVGEGETPSFPDIAWACRAFFDGDFSLTGNRDAMADLAVVRVAEQGAQLGGVHITATELKVAVEGDDVHGTDLELYGVEQRRVERLDGPSVVVIPLPSGLPSHAWLWLKRGTVWLDYRSLDPTSAWTGGLQGAGVEIDRPVDPVATVEALIASGEGPQLEFKEMLPTKENRRTLKTVAAFANGDGGAIVFGIHRDEVTLPGLSEDKPSTQMRDELTNLVRSSVQPTPDFDIKEYRPGNKLVFVLEVQPGQNGPYGLVNPRERDKQPEYFVRRGANTYPAQPGELRAIVLRNNGTPSGLTGGRYSGFGSAT
ncbi:ATP-binding protein [Kitasatospora sp. NBC_01287]|uniref:AlbA family DNA-binding domain-containing protein n=1 Tax=Kitasatospora sp. NBC_01287 TaxID=2903573 RepID=UPI00225B5A28|nr:ATP-binding protein [Kitasatospora sp. NBC_01287]MCX4745197.1 ATP-binding protein [Kitasatospora sp. NBC_01287]